MSGFAVALQQKKSLIFSKKMTEETNLNNSMSKLSAGENASQKYIPPHGRNAGKTPPTVPSAFKNDRYA
jgi:hypothetical protein